MCVVNMLWSFLNLVSHVKLVTHVFLSSPVLKALKKKVPPSGSLLSVRWLLFVNNLL